MSAIKGCLIARSPTLPIHHTQKERKERERVSLSIALSQLQTVVAAEGCKPNKAVVGTLKLTYLAR